jgi:hypothetical protein
MQSPLRTLVIGYRTRLAACQRLIARVSALAAMGAPALLPGSATAQRAGGEIAVSLTILPAGVGQPMALAGSRIDHVETASSPIAPAPTMRRPQVVAPTPSSDLRDSVVGRQEPAMRCTESRLACVANGIAHRVDVRRHSPDDTGRVLRLRGDYFVVPGT